MPDLFHRKIQQSISNEGLQVALDANATRRIQGRATALASLPDWQERRQRAHAIRAEVIAHLDNYLELFTAKATSNGITVHRANDAAEAIKIFLGIIGKDGRSNLLIAKSKSMVTEEIELNHAVEKAGHRVVETDLGEYIVQLRGERPSHIITPAVHLRRHEVGELFAEKLGVPYSEDIPTLTNIARKVLREVFLTADVGVSGVNFGVAETGTLTLVTNEGNGRMVTTLPPIHIALMGMERLVRNLDDLALMLSLLPRSATGQKISVYTQLIQRPDPSSALGGSQKKHLILVDNGRSALHNSHLAEALYCIRCGACLNACPVFRELGGHGYLGKNGSIAPYPGPIGSVISPGLFGKNYFQLAQASSLCGACKDACPVNIDLPKLLTRVRAGDNQDQGNALPTPLKFGLRMYTRLATRPSLFALSQRLAWLGARLVSPVSAWMKFPAFPGWGYSKDFPRPAAKPFRVRFNHRDAETTEKLIQNTKKPNEPCVSAVEKELISQFAEELSVLSGHLIETTALELSDHLISLLREKNINRVQTWDQISGIDWAEITAAGISVQHEADAHIEAGITGALAGIAETGTLVVPGGAGRPLTASLVPEIHIAVLRASNIVQNMETAFQLPDVTASPSTVLISGPSRTADIEMTLTIGVHGPGELHVFLLTE